MGKRKREDTSVSLLALMLWDKSLEGDLRAAEYVADRLLGRPAQEIRLEGHQPSLIFQILDPTGKPELPAPVDEVIEGQARELAPEEAGRDGTWERAKPDEEPITLLFHRPPWPHHQIRISA